MVKAQRWAAALVLLLAGAAGAQTLPAPQEFYFDEDRSALKVVEPVKGSDDVAVKRLTAIVDRGDHKADEAHAQLAGLLMASGRRANGALLYDQLLTRLDARNALRRPVLYRYGWDLYRAGDAAGALAQWQQLVAGRGINPSWAPPTLALALWKLDRKDEAVRWYAAAVRTEPKLWSSTARYATLLPEWTEAERKDLADVQAAWARNPPKWP